ncbi:MULTISPECIES: hypothetical protein [Xanthomonas]|uniref:hypothetical protein n=1 Tax=Xanthomonas TaxID=338 RepID=UPI0011B0936A|nr:MULTISPECIES: hypothetical protein [Xanthomonas]HHZ24262.1 hypothetical protein [Xanthomonas vasicola pv. zeae]HHZ28986.1 hypothetical protein [Xanthomonas vasicola pv. zeae]
MRAGEASENEGSLPPRKALGKISAEELVQMSFRLSKPRWKKLRALGIDERASVQSIIISALEAEFARRGLTF